MPASKAGGSKRARGAYSRLLCLGCRDRRIRCELPSDVDVPEPGELRTVQTPCYRCKRLGIPCVVRQTVLGRPRDENKSAAAVDTGSSQSSDTGDIISRIIIELPRRPKGRQHIATARQTDQPAGGIITSRNDPSDDSPPRQEDVTRWNRGALLVHTPQSTETVIIIRALDTISCEKVGNEYFRHLPAHVGHEPALDLSVKAIVAACAYGRGVPKLTSGDCYQALALALNAVWTSINKKSGGKLSDDILASTALLAPFDGVMHRHGHGSPTRLHVEGMAAILAARPETYPVTQLAREILDFHICDSAILSCIWGMPSPFEGVPRGYLFSGRSFSPDSDLVRLKALGSELFVRIPRLVGLIRALRRQSISNSQLLQDALVLAGSLLHIQDTILEARLLHIIPTHPSGDTGPISQIGQSFQFASVDEFEAVGYYWQTRLWLLSLQQRLHGLVSSSLAHHDRTARCAKFPPAQDREMMRLLQNILMCAEYAETLPTIRKHDRLFAHGILIVWGAVRNMQLQYGTDGLHELLMQRMNSALAGKPYLTAEKLGITIEDMDLAADVFVGGEAKGRFVELYRF